MKIKMRYGQREDRVGCSDSVNCRSSFGGHLDADLGMLVPAELSSARHRRRAVGDLAPALEEVEHHEVDGVLEGGFVLGQTIDHWIYLFQCSGVIAYHHPTTGQVENKSYLSPLCLSLLRLFFFICVFFILIFIRDDPSLSLSEEDEEEEHKADER